MVQRVKSRAILHRRAQRRAFWSGVWSAAWPFLGAMVLLALYVLVDTIAPG
jgi:Na+-driven multidrug efflux pump